MKFDTGLVEPIQQQEKAVDFVPLPIHERVREFVRASKAENTLRGYKSDWRDFYLWCEVQRACPRPASPEIVAAYIADCAERLKVGSIQRRLNAIAEAHKAIGIETPTHSALVRNTLKGIKRTRGTATTQKAPTLTDDIRAMVSVVDSGLIGVRDKSGYPIGIRGCIPPIRACGVRLQNGGVGS